MPAALHPAWWLKLLLNMSRITLVLNAGSSSVKFAVARSGKIFIRGNIDHFGKTAGIRLVAGRHISSRTAAIANPQSAFRAMRKILNHLNITPDLVAHRIVHGGRNFSKPTKLTPLAIKQLHSLIELAPLHQPVNLMGIAFAKKTWPKATAWGIFDTAIYRTLPVKVRTYALPRGITKRLHIEKYGFHGISHEWAFHQAAKRLKGSPPKLSAVTLHLGSGASMTLWKRGRPIDTTMGFTPLEGLVMSTRSGDIDPSIPLYIQEKLGFSAKHVGHLLEQHAGLFGLSGLHDMRDVLGAAGHHVPGWPRKHWPTATRVKAKKALDVFIYHVRRTLAGYLGLSDVQAIVFTGPVGTNQTIQKMVLHNLPAARSLTHLTIDADEERAIVEAVQK